MHGAPQVAQPQTSSTGSDTVDSPASPKRISLPALTGIRFFAAIYVVVGHELPWIEKRVALPSFARNFLSNGYLAVCLFFLLSGFILAYTYSGITLSRRKRIEFWEARFARIYPVYLFSLLLALPFQFHALTLKSSVAVLLMLQAWNPLHPELSGAWNYPAWSLSVEAFFYLCFPFIQTRITFMCRRVLLLLGVFVLFACVLCRTPVQGLGLWNPSAFASIPIPLPIVRFPEVLLGVLMGNYFVRYRSLANHPFLTLVAILATFFQRHHSSPGRHKLFGLSAATPVRDWVRTLSAHTTITLNAINAPLTPLILVLFSIFVFRYLEEPLRKVIRRGLPGWL